MPTRQPRYPIQALRAHAPACCLVLQVVPALQDRVTRARRAFVGIIPSDRNQGRTMSAANLLQQRRCLGQSTRAGLWQNGPSSSLSAIALLIAGGTRACLALVPSKFHPLALKDSEKIHEALTNKSVFFRGEGGWSLGGALSIMNFSYCYLYFQALNWLSFMLSRMAVC